MSWVPGLSAYEVVMAEQMSGSSPPMLPERVPAEDAQLLLVSGSPAMSAEANPPRVSTGFIRIPASLCKPRSAAGIK
jgi:hypothetical protein